MPVSYKDFRKKYKDVIEGAFQSDKKTSTKKETQKSNANNVKKSTIFTTTKYIKKYV